ncbi:hypothetical protein ACX80D_09395 [Arthrobacter sp. Sr24]
MNSSLSALGNARVLLLAIIGGSFTRRLPPPPANGDKNLSRTRNSVLGGWVGLGLVLVGALAILLFAPRGREFDVIAILPMIVAVPNKARRRKVTLVTGGACRRRTLSGKTGGIA